MSFNIEHLYVEFFDQVTVSAVNIDTRRVRYANSGTLPIRHPGTLNIATYASYSKHTKGSGLPPVGGTPNAPLTQVVPLNLTVKIYSPDGLEHTTGHVTLDDLNRFRDLRNSSQGSWSYQVSGDSGPIFMPAEVGAVSPGKVSIRIALEETVPSQSAGPLVNSRVTLIGGQIFSFDLFRVGMFEASVQSNDLVLPWYGVLKLRNPDGAVVAESSNSGLTFAVTLQTINQSRDASGQVRVWSLEVDTSSPTGIGGVIRATVIATTRIPVAILEDRINYLIGTGGKNLSIYGENKSGRVLCRIVIEDPYSAETIDINGLMDKVLSDTPQDAGVDTAKGNVEAGVVYSLANRSDSLDYGLSMDVSSMKVDAVKITVGASQHIQPSIPALTLELDVQGGVDINLGGFTLVTATVSNNRITLETGVTLDESGNLVTMPWLNDNPIDLLINWETAALAGLIGGALLDLGLVGLTAYLQSEVNNQITGRFQSIVEDAIGQAPGIMAMLLGANFTLTSLRMENDAIVFDYVAPVEPDPKPSRLYVPVIGRRALMVAPGVWQMFPIDRTDTWANNNLSKIDHIVVVMMENRAFDHVLGYRASLPNAQGEDGLSADLLNFLQQFMIQPLSGSDIPPNAQGLKTRFPASVGHKLADVAQQLSERLQMPNGQSINSPQGFLDNFASRTGDLDPYDVLGYYTDSDLAFYKFLAENFAYCERYFSAHPGPTLPNRMYSLGGDVQYDRVGEAILDNNNGDNFSLSRALNIFDVLSRKGVGWRVYESFPSVTMLRMFARYVADTTNIVPIAQLERDIAAGNLPAVTFIDPAMHSAPENDDHSPYADMLAGQVFIKRVYDALHSNPGIWQKTLLVVTYDEHGGFYDHVIPPVADGLSLPPELSPGGTPPPPTTFKSDMMIPYGLRVPTFVISPWVPAGKGPDVTLDHCSILKTILARFCGADKPFLTDRVNASHTLESFLTESQPRLSASSPGLPSLFAPKNTGQPAIVTKPLSRKAMRAGDADFHDLTGMLARVLGRH